MGDAREASVEHGHAIVARVVEAAGPILKQLRDNKDEEGFRRLLTQGREIARTIRSLSKPVIAAVNGVAVGGGFEIALAADLIIASEKARFGLPEPRVGLVAGGI